MPVYIPWKDTEREKQEDSSDVLLKCNVTGNAKKQLGGVCVGGSFGVLINMFCQKLDRYVCKQENFNDWLWNSRCEYIV